MQAENQNSPEYGLAALDIGLFQPETLCFYKTPHGFTALKQGEKDYGRVILSRAMPFADPDRFISVCDAEQKEIGILRDIGSLPPEQQEIVRAELAKRYYCPVLSVIHSIKEKMGYFYFDVSVGSFRKSFAVKDISRSVRQLDNGQITITDVDGSRYLIADFSAINAKSRKALEPYLY